MKPLFSTLRHGSGLDSESEHPRLRQRINRRVPEFTLTAMLSHAARWVALWSMLCRFSHKFLLERPVVMRARNSPPQRLDCCLISSSGELLATPSGPMIDRCCSVIRISEAPTVSYETLVGSKTDVRIVGNERSVIPTRSVLKGERVFPRVRAAKSAQDAGMKAEFAISDCRWSSAFPKKLRQSDVSTGYLAAVFAANACDDLLVFGFNSTSFQSR